MNFTVKKAQTEEEIKGKAYVHFTAWHEAYEGLVDPGYLAALTLEKCEKVAFALRDGLFVAKDGDRVIGFSSAGKCRDEDLSDAGEVFAVYILKEYYGSGVGKALMDAALASLDDKVVAVWVLSGNSRAIRFYEKCGFYPDGAEKTVNLGAPATEIRMVLTA